MRWLREMEVVRTRYHTVGLWTTLMVLRCGCKTGLSVSATPSGEVEWRAGEDQAECENEPSEPSAVGGPINEEQQVCAEDEQGEAHNCEGHEVVAWVGVGHGRIIRFSVAAEKGLGRWGYGIGVASMRTLRASRRHRGIGETIER